MSLYLCCQAGCVVSVIPTDNPNILTLDRRTLLSAIKRVLPFASASSQLIRFNIETGKVEVSSEDIDFSTSAKETLICDYGGQKMSIGFRGDSLIEILNSLDSEEECPSTLLIHIHHGKKGLWKTPTNS